MKAYVVKLNSEMEAIVNEISDYTGVLGFPNIMRLALTRAVLQLRDEQTSIRKPKTAKTPEDKAAQYVAEQEARRKAREERALEAQKALAHQLNGTIFEHVNGNLHVKYNTYDILGNKVVVYEQLEPLNMLTEEHVANQYKPSKEAVEAAQANV